MATRRAFLHQLALAAGAAPTVQLLQRSPASPGAPPRAVSGIYPALAMFNDEQECGIGAVVPWAGRLWAITYGPHLVRNSSDKLYEITDELRQIVRPESVGGTNANRLIHRGSNQLFIGPYAIDDRGAVRVIPRNAMPGRLTGTARHLTDADKIYFATMEEGLYEVDVRSLSVTGLIKDGNGSATSTARPAAVGSALPGYHGKGLYTGQQRLVYANNGEAGAAAERDPTTTSGALAEWRGRGDWTLVRRNQFTEVSGPGGLTGGEPNSTDPVWSIGWDHRSLILMLLDRGEWRTYRLPKASHTYDGAHGWNTEWPRIRDIGEADWLMTMHGMLWKFPPGFSRTRSRGIVPRSSYLKVVGDFCRWKDQVVFGCDDTATAAFLNKRKAKGAVAGPGQSQSNLWFVEPSRLDRLGPVAARGALWLDEPVAAGATSEPFLFDGFERRAVHLAHASATAIELVFEIDGEGRDEWRELRRVEVAASGYAWVDLTAAERGAWLRVKSTSAAAGVTALVTMSNRDGRDIRASALFDGLAAPGDRRVTGGLLHARGRNLRTLGVAAARGIDGKVTPGGYYELDAALRLAPGADTPAAAWMRTSVAIPRNVVTVERSSVLVEDDAGRRWRFPRSLDDFDRPGPLGAERVDREVCTERDLFNCHGTFYELPAENAGGFAKVRPIATHDRRIHDYCSYRGLLVMTGIAADARGGQIVRSDDGRAAVWVGAVDDLWQLGRPRGRGGPWIDTVVEPNQPSDPFLFNGYEEKALVLTHDQPGSVAIDVQVDVSGDGHWSTCERFDAPPGGEGLQHRFPAAFSACWIRFVARRGCRATATLTYT